ncbi:glycerol-3-phosphate dehydrogenase [soil metagenome]
MAHLALSSLNREHTLQEFQQQTFDLLVIGGGITGAGIALDAVARGMSVALVEKNDFASGTSSRSTKLIHGGLRYLKQFEIALVREVGRERDIIWRNAPHVVHPENMLLPIIEKGSLGKSSTSVGLYVYDVLAGVKRSERRVMLDKAQTLNQEPLLRKDIVLGGGLYKEYRTDDARLTIEVLKTARKRGATILNYVQANKFVYQNKKAIGAEVQDVIGGSTFEIKAHKIVNAAGPWVDELRQSDNSLKGKRLHLTKGVHIVVPYERLPLKQAIYFDVADGRMIFAIPRDKVTYIGTTDTNYKGEIDHPITGKADVEYLLKAINAIIPGQKLVAEDVNSSWAGLRPLIHEDGKDPSELSRKDEIFLSPSGVISIAGGKLTGFRKMAERTVDLVAEQLSDENQKNYAPCTTQLIKLTGGEFANPGELNHLIAAVQEITDLKEIEARILVEKYGSNTSIILSNAKAKEGTWAQKLLLAEIDYSINEELAYTPADFLVRRTGRLYFDRDSIDAIYPTVIDTLFTTLKYSEEQREQFEAWFNAEYRQAVQFE